MTPLFGSQQDDNDDDDDEDDDDDDDDNDNDNEYADHDNDDANDDDKDDPPGRHSGPSRTLPPVGSSATVPARPSGARRKES